MGFLVLQGYGSAMALIMAIGAQNAFVLGKGVQRHYHWPVAAICILCDLALISAGMLGAGLRSVWEVSFFFPFTVLRRFRVF
jgi:L-lysine exporter family protein LysE/ArgO